MLGGPPGGFLPCRFGGWGRGKEKKTREERQRAAVRASGVVSVSPRVSAAVDHTHTHAPSARFLAVCFLKACLREACLREACRSVRGRKKAERRV